MPADALPIPRGERGPGPARVRYRQVYRDVLDRPMRGKVRISPRAAVVEPGVVIPAAPVEVALVEGAIDVQLPPGRYIVAAQLTTVDGAGVVDNRDADLAADETTD